MGFLGSKYAKNAFAAPIPLRWGSLQRSPDSLVGFGSCFAAGREGKGGWRKREGKGMGMRWEWTGKSPENCVFSVAFLPPVRSWLYM